MGKKQVNAASNQKLNLQTRKGHKSASKDGLKSKSRKRTTEQKKAEKKRIQQIGSRPVLEELNNPRIVAILGQEPVYLHSNKIYAEKGLDTVNRELQRMLTKYTGVAKQHLQQQQARLKQLENDFYISNPYIKNFQSLEQWWKNTYTNNSNADFQAYFDALLSITHLDWELTTHVTNKSYKQIEQELHADFQKLEKWRETHPSKELDSLFARLIKEANYKYDNNQITFDMSKLIKTRDLFGFQFEKALEEGALVNEIGSQISQEVLDGAKQSITVNKIGLKKQGQAASDNLIKIGEVGIGVSAKLRHGIKNINGQSVIEYRFGSKATGENLNSYFYRANNSFVISDEDFNIIKYGLMNWQNNSPIANSSVFITRMKALMAWNKIVFAFLGEDYSTATTPPVFLAHGHEIIRMNSILQAIVAMPTENILNIINKNVGDWNKKHTLSQTKKETLYKSKKTVLKNNRDKKTKKNIYTVSYPWLKNNIQDVLNQFQLPTRKIEITYKIISNNFKNLQL